MVTSWSLTSPHMEFVLVFAVVFIVGFVVREVWRAAMTTKCPHCRSQVDKTATVCKACGRETASV